MIWDNMMNAYDTLNLTPMETTALGKSRFTEMLIDENALVQNGFEAWLFCHGMLFNSPDKWWGDRGRRDYPHEGIDLCLYRDCSKRIRRLDERTRIPVIQDGVVKAVFKDYIGQAVFVEHKAAGSGTGKLLSMYAHTKPRPGIEVGAIVKEGDIIATIGDTRNLKSGIIPHLHFSLGRPSASLSYDGFVWNTIRKPDAITLLDPMAVLDWPYQALDVENPVCREI